jgi:hypothetical protein
MAKWGELIGRKFQGMKKTYGTGTFRAAGDTLIKRNELSL